jgi:signal transduction histidine kinase
VQISISDNGPGIADDIREKIFRPNFTTKSNGNGLGLAISKHIVEGSGGRIEFETSPKGTTFFVCFKKPV